MPWMRSLRLWTGPVDRAAQILPGLYHYLREVDGQFVRIHLRVDPQGSGLLLANANALARLSRSGVLIAKGLLDGAPSSVVVKRVKSLFRGVTTEQVAGDVAAVQTLIERSKRPTGDYPISNLVDPAFSPNAGPPGRPISADVPLCPPPSMQRILDRLWQQGIPHVTILVGRNPDEAALVRAVERAGDLGLITGVRGRGSDLATGSRIADLAAAGLDHLNVYCLAGQAAAHDAMAGVGDWQAAAGALAAARQNEICPVAEIALVQPALPTLQTMLEGLADDGVRNVGLFAIAAGEPPEVSGGALAADELPPIAQRVESLAERLDLRLLWYPTVRWDPTRTLADQACGGPRSSGDTAIRVEPDGSVYAPRGPWRAAGNLLEQDWDAIEQSETFECYGRRIGSNTHCDTCPGLAICAADCPRDPAGWALGWDEGRGAGDEG